MSQELTGGAILRNVEQLESRGGQEGPGGARRSQEVPVGARRCNVEPF